MGSANPRRSDENPFTLSSREPTVAISYDRRLGWRVLCWIIFSLGVAGAATAATVGVMFDSLGFGFGVGGSFLGVGTLLGLGLAFNGDSVHVRLVRRSGP